MMDFESLQPTYGFPLPYSLVTVFVIDSEK